MKSRFHSLHSKLMRGDVDGARDLAADTLEVIKTAVENEMSVELTDYYVDVLERTVIDLKYHMFNCVFERIWTLAYTDKLYV